nr:hypothetical protein [Thermoleophilaceae bacterium]
GPRPRLGRGARRAALASLFVLLGVIAWGLPISSDGPTRAQVRLTGVPSGDGRMVQATIRVSPPDALEGAHFANVTAWQGGGSVVSKLREVGTGGYRTTEPIPVHGGWKALLRVHTGDSLVGVPVYLPRDRAIPAPEVPARASFTRPFVRDVQILQREQKEDVNGGAQAHGLPHRRRDRRQPGRSARVGPPASGGDRAERTAATHEKQEFGAARRIGVDTHDLNASATFPKHLVASPTRRIRGDAERGNQGGVNHWGEPPEREARKLFQREPVS